MQRVEPIRALHYDLQRTGGLEPVLAPPYDVIDPTQRAELAARSPFNAVAIDLPEPAEGSPDRYAGAARLLEQWRAQRILVHDEQPAIWVLAQEFVGPDGRRRTRTGFLARVRVEEYGAGRIRPHERTHPGPRQDRLELLRATRANTSPIFTLYGDGDGAARRALELATAAPAWAQATTDDGTLNRVWRVGDPDLIGQLAGAAAAGELLIADGHHRYETARVYAEQVGGEGPHRYVLMCLVALEDDGLIIFPTHRLLRRPDRDALARALEQDFDTRPVRLPAELFPAAGEDVRFGVAGRSPELRALASARARSVAEALPGRSAAYRRLDTAVLEALILKKALGMSDEQIDALDGLGYARDGEQALASIDSGAYDVAFLMAPTPIATVREIAAAGEIMPPKSTYFFPKVPTGILFNPLED